MFTSRQSSGSDSKQGKVNTAFTPPDQGLAKFGGDWTFKQAAHLLRRCMFGPALEQIKWSVENGMEATVAKLFEELPMPSPPVLHKYEEDPHVALGETWINAPYNKNILSVQQGARNTSLVSWTIGLMLEEGISLREKLTLFWHNHFPIEAILDPKYCYWYVHKLRKNAWGNFRELVKEITIDPAMLLYLNGNQNDKLSPNENHARELLELFTIGKGPLASPGDYTNYTEEDVKEIARVLTGWRDYGFTLESTGGSIGARFYDDAHDTGIKKLSPRFNNVEISNMGDQEYAYLIDIIFQQRETARFICRKLYRWFVYYQIDAQVENEIIQPMAQLLIDNDFEVKPALQALISSEHFYQEKYIGAMIKNPLDFMMSAIGPLKTKFPDKLDQKYDSWYALYGLTRAMQMIYFSVPQVAGWRAYYISPGYYREWVNSTTLPVRMEFTEVFAKEGHFPFTSNGPRIKADVLGFTASLEDPLDPNALVKDYVRVLLPQSLSLAQRAKLKEILIPGLPDFEWTVEYGNYLQDPQNSELASAVEMKLRQLLHTIYSLPDFQLS